MNGENCDSIRNFDIDVYNVDKRTCAPGTDCIDCGGVCVIKPSFSLPPQPPSYCEGKHICENNSSKCLYVNDGYCDDGGMGSEFSQCNIGLDCDDCGKRCNYTESCIHYNISTYSLSSVPIGWTANTNVKFFNSVSEHNNHYLFSNSIPPVVHSNKFFSISSNVLTENMLGLDRPNHQPKEMCENLATANNGTYKADVLCDDTDSSNDIAANMCLCSVNSNNTWKYVPGYQAFLFTEKCLQHCYVFSSTVNYNVNLSLIHI